MKKLLKFKFQDKEGFFSVVEDEKQYYTLIQKDSPKAVDIQNKHQMWISYDLKQPNFKKVDVTLSFDINLVKSIYEQLERENNLYFKQLDDQLCVLIIAKA